ncbi:MAG TPA: AraC family transcriptional regulator [Pyrinomonadaceae bacterium]|nr:AraC family transcriptional regulator [Pyrinomonadaceae bacterium]
MDHKGCHDYFLPPASPLATLETLESVRERIIYSRRLERLWLFIEESYSDPDVRLNDAAKSSGVSQDHLNLLLRRFADTTFHDLLARYRIEKCLGLFYERNYTLTEIYSRCGFNSPTTFERQFKRWVGCLPREYKSSMTTMRAASKASTSIFE